MVRRTWILVLALALAAVGGGAAQTLDPEIEKGIALVRRGDYAEAIIVLDGAARRLGGNAATAKEAARAYVHLGICYVAEGQENLASASFREAVTHDPALELSAFDMSPSLRALFQKAKDDVQRQKRSEIAPEKKKGGKTGLVLLGVGGAGAAVAVAAAGGGGSSTPATTTPALPTPGITFLGGTPAPGSTVAIGGCLDADCANNLTLRFQVVSSTNVTKAEMKIELFSGNTRCMFGFTDTIDLVANQPQVFQEDFFSTDCRVPFSTDRIHAVVFRDADFQTVLEQVFSATYHFVF